MPDGDGHENWRPNRGPVFKAVVWALLVLMAMGVLGGVAIGVMF